MKGNWAISTELGALAFLSIPLSFWLYDYSIAMSSFIRNFLSIILLGLLIYFLMRNLKSVYGVGVSFRKMFRFVFTSLLLFTAVQLILSVIYLKYFQTSYANTMINRQYHPLEQDGAAQTVGQRLALELIFSTEGIIISNLLMNLIIGMALASIFWAVLKRRLLRSDGIQA